MIDTLILWIYNLLIVALLGCLVWTTGLTVTEVSPEERTAWYTAFTLLAYGLSSHVTWICVRRWGYSGRHAKGRP